MILLPASRVPVTNCLSAVLRKCGHLAIPRGRLCAIGTPHSRVGFARKKSSSSGRWLQRQHSDPYVKKAVALGYRARSAFKLLEMNQKHSFLQPGAVVIDCGARPGSWSQVAVQKVFADSPSEKKKGMVIAVDIELMDPVEGAIVLDDMDFTEEDTKERLRQVLAGRSVDVILSDMAPNASGSRHLDHDRIMVLCADAFTFACDVLRPGGVFLAKAWNGAGLQAFEAQLQRVFDVVKRLKPPSSRGDSAEIFFLAKGFKNWKEGYDEG